MRFEGPIPPYAKKLGLSRRDYQNLIESVKKFPSLPLGIKNNSIEMYLNLPSDRLAVVSNLQKEMERHLDICRLAGIDSGTGARAEHVSSLGIMRFLEGFYSEKN